MFNNLDLIIKVIEERIAFYDAIQEGYTGRRYNIRFCYAGEHHNEISLSNFQEEINREFRKRYDNFFETFDEEGDEDVPEWIRIGQRDFLTASVGQREDIDLTQIKADIANVVTWLENFQGRQPWARTIGRIYVTHKDSGDVGALELQNGTFVDLIPCRWMKPDVVTRAIAKRLLYLDSNILEYERQIERLKTWIEKRPTSDKIGKWKQDIKETEEKIAKVGEQIAYAQSYAPETTEEEWAAMKEKVQKENFSINWWGR